MNNKSIETATKTIVMGAEDSRLNYNDSHIMNHLEAVLALQGFASVNIRRIFVTKGEVDTSIRTNIDHTYVTIDFITKEGEEISDETYKIAEDFVLSINRKDIKLNAFEAADAMAKILIDSAVDSVSASNIIRCIFMRSFHPTTNDEVAMHKYIGTICTDIVRHINIKRK